MQALTWKLRIAALWAFYAIGIMALFVLSLMEPGMLDDISNGEVEGNPTEMVAVVGVVYILLPAVLVFLTFVVPDTVGRWMHGVAGVFFTLTMVPDIVGHWGAIAGVFITVCATVLCGLAILWHVWKWPRSTEQTKETAPQREHAHAAR